MKSRFHHIVQTAAAVAVVSGCALAASGPARAELLPSYLSWIDFRPNLKISSSLSAPYYNAGIGGMALNLTYRIENNGLTPAPATTLALTLETGDPFSPISTAIALQHIATPALASGAATPVSVLVIPEAVYIKVDLRADALNAVNERTENDNHRVHSAGYAP